MGVILTEPMLRLVDEPVEWTSPEIQQLYIDRPEVGPREVTGTIIVCGNCAGDDPLPVKTLMTKTGCCASCGGSSYVLASNLYINVLASKLFQEHLRRQTV